MEEVSTDMLKKALTFGTIDVTLRYCGPASTEYGTFHPGSERRIEEVGIVPEKAMKRDAKSHTAG